ncbi:MAG: hypothetical protein V1913_08220 [Fibrobacterota bacterium]
MSFLIFLVGLITTLAFTLLKLLNMIAWPWLVVLLPLWISIVVVFVIWAGRFIVSIIIEDRKKSSSH